MRLRSRALVAVALAPLLLVGAAVPHTPLVGVLPVTSASAKSSSETERAKVKEKRANVAAKLDTLRAKDADVQAALDALTDNVSTQTRLAREAKNDLADAEAELASAQSEEAFARSRIDTVGVRLRESAIRAYVSAAGGTSGDDPLSLLTVASDPSEQMYRAAYADVSSGDVETLLDDLRVARLNLTEQRERAERAQENAAATKQRNDERLAKLQTAKQQTEAFANKLEDRIDSLIGEAQSLAAVDKKLADQIAKEQAAAAARLRRAQIAAGVPRARSGGSVVVPASGDDVATTVVYGIRVNVAIADNLQRLVEAAGNDGFQLGGGGFRSRAAQIAVRRNNCGSSDYDIWQKPASACRPPAAKPGRSMHELGLAIDFTCNGALIMSYSSACARWFIDNAANYGFYNRRGEAWHWSTNGH